MPKKTMSAPMGLGTPGANATPIPGPVNPGQPAAMKKALAKGKGKKGVAPAPARGGVKGL